MVADVSRSITVERDVRCEARCHEKAQQRTAPAGVGTAAVHRAAVERPQHISSAETPLFGALRQLTSRVSSKNRTKLKSGRSTGRLAAVVSATNSSCTLLASRRFSRLNSLVWHKTLSAMFWWVEDTHVHLLENGACEEEISLARVSRLGPVEQHLGELLRALGVQEMLGGVREVLGDSVGAREHELQLRVSALARAFDRRPPGAHRSG